MLHRSLTLALAAGLVCATPAYAVTFSASSTTGVTGSVYPFDLQAPPIGPIGVELKVRFIPSLSSFLGPQELYQNYFELQSTLVDSNLDVAYNYPLPGLDLPLFHFNPVVSPYLGLRYLAVPSSQGLSGYGGYEANIDYSQFGGINYGVKASTDLPLGFSANAYAELSTLFSGGWAEQHFGSAITSSGQLAVGGLTLPAVGFTVGWTLFGLIGLYGGYEVYSLPTGLRTTTSPTLPSSLTWLSGWSVGGNLVMLTF